MRKRRFCSILPFALILVFAAAAIAAMSSANYSLIASVLSNGGTTMDSANYKVTSTFGQSSAIGQSSSSSYTNYAGFWQPAQLKVKGKAMPWIPLLLLDE